MNEEELRQWLQRITIILLAILLVLFIGFAKIL